MVVVYWYPVDGRAPNADEPTARLAILPAGFVFELLFDANTQREYENGLASVDCLLYFNRVPY